MKKLRKQKKNKTEKLSDITNQFLKGELLPKDIDMDNEPMINIQGENMSYNEELKRWREERDITVESQKPGLLGNLLEETMEVARAKNLDGVVDGLLDYSVYLANALEEINLDQDLTEEEAKEVETKKRKFKELDDQALVMYKNYFLFKLMDGIKSASLVVTKDLVPVPKEAEEKIKLDTNIHIAYLNSLFRLIKSAIMIAGYDFDKAFKETFKAIHSRKGKWSTVLNKFEKDKDQLDRYEPNYDNAKIK